MRRRVRFIALFALALSVIGGSSLWAQSCYGTSDSSQVNVMCDILGITDSSQARQTLMRSICMVEAEPGNCGDNGTGTLINSFDCWSGEPRAYVLTATHVISAARDANRMDSVLFIFNYVDTGCSVSDTAFTGTCDTVVGAREVWEAYDVALVELSSVPDTSWHLFYAGWARNITDFTGAVFFGHPSTDVMKMGVDTNVADVYPYVDSTSWPITSGRVMLWNLEAGIGQAGFSGSSVFNRETSRLVGATGGQMPGTYNTDSAMSFVTLDSVWNKPDACCSGMTGNLDLSSDGLVTASDLAIMIDHLYGSLKPLVCTPAGNTDGSGDGLITMGDLSAMIDYLYITLTPLPQCDSVPRPTLGDFLDPDGTDSAGIQGYDPVDSTYEYCD